MTIETTVARQLTHNGCVSKQSVPPFELLTQSFWDARVIKDAPAHGLSREHCSSRDSPLVEIIFAGNSYAVCSPANGPIDAVFGENMKLVFTHVPLPTQFCDAATLLAPSADPMALDGLAVLAHSMGNLIVANAAAKKLCAIGSSSK